MSTYTQVTVLCDKKVAWLQVSMDHSVTVGKPNATNQLIHKVLVMSVCKRLLTLNNAMKISVHELHDHV